MAEVLPLGHMLGITLGMPDRRIGAQQFEHERLEFLVQIDQKIVPLPVNDGEPLLVIAEIGRATVGRPERLQMLMPPLFRAVDPDVPDRNALARGPAHRNNERRGPAGRQNVAAVATALLLVVLVQVDLRPAAQQLRIVLHVSEIGGRKNHCTNRF